MAAPVVWEWTDTNDREYRCADCGQDATHFVLGRDGNRYYGSRGFFCGSCMKTHEALLHLTQLVPEEDP